MPPTLTAGSNRIFYLDALRAFTMLYGILNHSINIWRTLPGTGPLVVSEFNSIFRLVTFFFISGFFTAMAYGKMPTREYVRSRLEIIALPLAVCLVVLAPVTNWLVFRFHNGPISLEAFLFEGGWRLPSAGENVWHLHFWFLFTLLVFALIAPPFLRLFRSGTAARAVARFEALFGRYTLWGVVLLFSVLEVVLAGTHKLVVEPLVAGTPFAWLVRSVFIYLPCFLVGALCFVHRGLFESMHRVSLPGLLIFGVLYYSMRALKPEMPFALWGILHQFSRLGLLVFTVAALLWLFRRFVSGTSALSQALTASAYSFYLIHYTVIYAIANVMRSFTENGWIIYATILVLGTPLCVLFHTRIVAPSPLLRYLLNGRRSAPRQAAAAS